MRTTDAITLWTLARKYGIDTGDIDDCRKEDLFAKIGDIKPRDLTNISGIFRRLSRKEIDRCVEHPIFPEAVDRFVEASAHDCLTGLAFLKLGVPIRGMVLPPRARRAVDVRLTARPGGVLLADRKPVPLQGMTRHQQFRLEEMKVPLEVG